MKHKHYITESMDMMYPTDIRQILTVDNLFTYYDSNKSFYCKNVDRIYDRMVFFINSATRTLGVDPTSVVYQEKLHSQIIKFLNRVMAFYSFISIRDSIVAYKNSIGSADAEDDNDISNNDKLFIIDTMIDILKNMYPLEQYPELWF